MGIFDEPEKVRAEVSQVRSRGRAARRSWPLSARLLVGAMFVINILLAAFLVRTEIYRPASPANSTPLTLERPKAGSSPQLNAPPNTPVAQGSGLGLKTPPVEATPAALPGTQMAKRPATKTLLASKTQRPVLSAPMPRAVVYPPQKPLSQTPTPVRDPAAVSGTIANVAPAASVLAPSAVGLTAKGTRSGTTVKVASVGLPPMEKGLVTPKMPVAPISPDMKLVPRPPVKLENCGDDKIFIACPTLKIRYDTPYTSEAP